LFVLLQLELPHAYKHTHVVLLVYHANMK